MHPPERERDFKHAGAEAVHWLRDVHLATFRDRKRIKEDRLPVHGKGLEIFKSRLDPRDGACFPWLGHRLTRLTILCCHI